MKKIILVSILLVTLVYPHGGRTNSEGCHNQSGGSYHCHGKKSKKVVSKKQRITSSSGQYDCSRKYCKYMTSCNEAYYKYTQCGHVSLDRDRDGVPCENICGRR